MGDPWGRFTGRKSERRVMTARRLEEARVTLHPHRVLSPVRLLWRLAAAFTGVACPCRSQGILQIRATTRDKSRAVAVYKMLIKPHSTIPPRQKAIVDELSWWVLAKLTAKKITNRIKKLWVDKRQLCSQNSAKISQMKCNSLTEWTNSSCSCKI